MAVADRSLTKLESLKFEFGPDVAAEKQACLRALKSATLKNAEQVERLHETLCFMQAWPDDEDILTIVDEMLAHFSQRRDLAARKPELLNTGIAGTELAFRFYAATAQWLAAHWPGHVQIDWEDFDNAEAFEPFLNLLACYCETPALETIAMELKDWIDRLRGPHETDASFVIKRLAAVIPNTFLHEHLYDKFDFPLILTPGDDVPSRTHAKYDQSPIQYQVQPLNRSRPVVADEIARRHGETQLVSRAEGRRLVDLARSAMLTRQRDLDAFAYADPRDVSVLHDDGLQFVLYGVLPERRFLLETLYGYLVLKNGVPISYGAVTCLFNSAEIAYTVFDTFRGGESTHVYVRTLAVMHQVFGCDTFMIDPYQLGLDNDDALKSGAWWFYQKLGYRPRDKKRLQLMEQELKRMQRQPKHRSSLATLKQLVTENVYLSLDQQRDDVMGILELPNVGLHLTDLLAQRYGSDREQGETELAKEAAQKLRVKSFQGWSSNEKRAWHRWAPLVALIDDLDVWSRAEQESLVHLIRHKGSRQEIAYLHAFDAHPRLRKAIVKLT